MLFDQYLIVIYFINYILIVFYLWLKCKFFSFYILTKHINDQLLTQQFVFRNFVHKYKRMLVKQMVTESEAYIITLLTTLKHLKDETYNKTSQNLYSILSTYINDNIIERYECRMYLCYMY